MLRDVIDLETTFSGQMEPDEVESVLPGLKPEAVAARPAAAPAPAPKAAKPEPRAAAGPRARAPPPTTTTRTTAIARRGGGGGGAARPDPDEEEDEDQGNLSLAAMEAALKPQVLETLERIADDYVRLAEMQDDRISRDAEPRRELHLRPGARLPAAALRDRRARQLAAPAPEPHRHPRRPALRHQPQDHVARRRRW